MDTLKLNKLDELFREFDTKDTPGVVIGVTQHGETAYAKAFGMANLEYDLPLTLDSVLQVGSLSKQFTAFTALLLSEDGKLDLDVPVRQYLDYFPVFDHEITVRHLVHHVSGLRSTIAYGLLNGVAYDDVYTQDFLKTMAKKQKALNFEPDTFNTYCNLSYCLMAEIVAKVNGKSFRESVDELIFKPLGMMDSFFHDTKFELIKNRAEAYTVTPEGMFNFPILHASYGSTNMFSTIADMIKWTNELVNPIVFQPRMIEKAFIPHECKNGFKTGYGYGFVVHPYKGKTAVSHAGSDAAYRAHMYALPEDNTALIVLSNRSDFDSAKFSRQILDIVLNLPDNESLYNKVPSNLDISGTYYLEKAVMTIPIIKTPKGTFMDLGEYKVTVFQKEDNLYIIPDFNLEFAMDKNGNIIVLS